MLMHNSLTTFIRELYGTQDFIPLHQPTFSGNEKSYVNNTIDSTFVSSVGAYVDEFENTLSSYCDSAAAVAVVNGTNGLQAALHMAGVTRDELVITQSMTFVATCNAIHWLGAEPVFIDISDKTLGMCPLSLASFLDEYCELSNNICFHKPSGKRVRAVVPMHTFGHPVELSRLVEVCRNWHLTLVEDAAESLGSTYKGQHTGTFGRFGALSFNGNKIITTGGGGAVLCKTKKDGAKLKHFTTTAKLPHAFEFIHDEYACNARMPNLNAALGLAQLEQLTNFVDKKRQLAACYADFFKGTAFKFVQEPKNTRANYWLNAIVCENKRSRDDLLKYANESGVMMRPVWKPMHQLSLYRHCIVHDMRNTEWFAERLVNLPSSVPSLK